MNISLPQYTKHNDKKTTKTKITSLDDNHQTYLKSISIEAKSERASILIATREIKLNAWS